MLVSSEFYRFAKIIDNARRLRRLQAEVGEVQPLAMLTITWHLGDVVRVLRRTKHWTQQTLATKARGKLNKATIVSVERMDRSHGKETYERIADAFGLTLPQLYALVPGAQVDDKWLARIRMVWPFVAEKLKPGVVEIVEAHAPTAPRVPLRADFARDTTHSVDARSTTEKPVRAIRMRKRR